MARRAPSPPSIMILTALVILILAISASSNDTLRVGFYEYSCPQAEDVIYQTVSGDHLFDPSIAAGLLRLHFHDCFVHGCDASILLDVTPSGGPVEKDSPVNSGSLHGLEVIDFAKSRLELECPGIVSCSDILAFATRDVVSLTGLPYYTVPSGRRDGLSSKALDVLSNLPPPFASADLLTFIFAGKGFTQREMVVLSGAHSIGHAHCSSFDYRLYNYSSGRAKDPHMDPLYADYLKVSCPDPRVIPRELTGWETVGLNSMNGVSLDNSYYVGLQMGKGLLGSDQALTVDQRTREIVDRMAGNNDEWTEEFVKAMVKVGQIDVLTGNEGEVRRFCRSVN